MAMMELVDTERDQASDDDFAALFAAHHRDAVRLAYLLCGDAHRAEDVVADAFVKLYRRWQRGGIENPRAYLRRVVTNEMTSRFRRLGVERREASKRSGDDRGMRTPEEDLADADEVTTALAQLPQRQRTAVVLRFYSDLAERDIAEAMGVSVGTVKSNLSRGLERMRALLGDPG